MSEILAPLTIDELRADWPRDESGLLCARLAVRFLNSRLVFTAAGNDCNGISAPGEAAADKAHATLVREFLSLVGPKPEPVARTPMMKSLHRHRDGDDEKNPQPTTPKT